MEPFYNTSEKKIQSECVLYFFMHAWYDNGKERHERTGPKNERRETMYIFPEEIRKAYEAQTIPLVYDQLIDGQVVPMLLSDGFCELVGMEREQAMEWFRHSQFERLHPDDVGRIVQVSDDFARHRSGYDVIFRSRHEDGYHFIHAVGKWQIMPDGTELALLTYADVSQSTQEITALNEKYRVFQQDRFYTDQVTGIPNLNYLHEFARERIHRIRMEGKTPALFYSDVDSMQSYNSQYGFAQGDELLRLIAEVLNKTFPEALVTRGADDYFIAITPFDGERALLEQLDAANDEIRRRAFGNTMGIQAGICVYEENMQTAEAFDHAKLALKRLGSDLNVSYRFFSHEEDEQYWNQRYIVENFDKALHSGWFKVYYQGINRVDTAKDTAFEALARWVDPVRGIISPKEFIPTLEKYHLLYRLDLFIFEQVCREVAERHDAGLPMMPVSVNFSAQDFDHADIVSELNRLVDQYQVERCGIGRGYFIVEITEQDMAKGTERFHEQLRAIRRCGFKLWLDDFGSGYSSLNVFSRFDVDLVKFDMELLRNLNDHNGANREILRAMTGVARKLGVHTLAEGLETEEQRQFLREIGCELTQGYLFHRPEPLDSILYKLNCGQHIRPYETDEERNELIRKWFSAKS